MRLLKQSILEKIERYFFTHFLNAPLYDIAVLRLFSLVSFNYFRQVLGVVLLDFVFAVLLLFVCPTTLHV